MKFLVINGPNLNLLGLREPAIYGSRSFAALQDFIRASAAKAGVIGFTKALAAELATKGVTANAIAPGYIGTDMVMAIKEEIRQGIIDTVPVKRLGKPEEIGAAVVYLASELAGYVTGATLNVNGGLYYQ